MSMQICLEGNRGDWDWFDFDIKEPNLGLDFDEVQRVTGTKNPAVIDIEYENKLDDLFSYDGMGYTRLNSIIEQAEKVQDLDDYDLERLAIYMRTKGGDLDYALDHFDNHIYLYVGSSDEEDLAYENIQEFGIDEKTCTSYFDFADFGRTLIQDNPDMYEGDENEYEVGEEYIDDVYGGVEEYIRAVGLDSAMQYFDLEGYGRTLAIGDTYDKISGIWTSENFKQNTRKRKFTESNSAKKYTGRTWKEFIDDIETNSKFTVDSAYKDKYADWIILYSKFSKDSFDGKVTKYNDGTYELMDYNIKGSYESLNRGRKLHIKESFNEEKLEFDGYEFDPYSSWSNIWTDVIGPIVDSHFDKIGINGYTQQEAEDDIDAIINIFNDEFGTQYPNVAKACDKFFNP